MKHRVLILVLAISPVWADDHASLSTPPAGYRSVFVDYKPMADETVQDWRQANEQMGRLRGHMGHLDAEILAPSKAQQPSGTATEAAPLEKK